MKRFSIFSILCLVAVVNALSEEERKPIAECARELNFQDVEKFYKGIDEQEYMANPTDDVTCMIACVGGKEAKAKGTTLYKSFLQVVDQAYEHSFESDKFTREDVESKIDNCFLQELEECEFFKCVDPFNSPYAEVVGYGHRLTVGSGVAKSMFPSVSS